MISAIVAVDKDWGIGYQGELLERLPPDMKHFKELTDGNIVIMGRKTWDSLPIKPLSNRHNVIISATLPPTPLPQIITNNEIPVTIINLNDFINGGRPLGERYFLTDVFVIGGGEIYKQLLPYCDRVYVTKILRDHKNVDTYFPNLDKSNEWEIDTCTDLRDYNGIPYAFMTYERV